MPAPRLIAVVGPTASGKSALAVELARRLDGEIVGADSMQLYRYMDIGTAKPTEAERGGIIHHMIDVADPDEAFTASRYREMAAGIIEEIHSRGKRVILAGGTGLYIRALLKGLVETPEENPPLRAALHEEAKRNGVESVHSRLKALDPASAESIHPHNLVRVIRAIEVALGWGQKLSEAQKRHRFDERHYEVMMLGIDLPREVLYERIDARVDKMIEEGLKEEVAGLLARGYTRELKPMRGVGYKEICAHLIDSLPMSRAVELIKRDSRRYAKRQLTWFRKEDALWMTAVQHLKEARFDLMKSFLEAPANSG